MVATLLVIGALLVFGAGTGGSVANFEPLFTDARGLFTVMIVVPFLFVGFDVIPQSAEELNMPPRRMGVMIIVSVAAATLWYIMVILTNASSMPREQLVNSDLVTADAMAALFHSPAMANVLLVGGMAGILTSWIALLMGAARLLYAMGVSGMLPRWFAHIHPKYRTPSNAVLFIGVLSIAAPFFGAGALGWFVDSGSPSIVFTYMMVCIVFLLLRRREPEMDRPFRAGGATTGRVLGVTGVILTAGLLSLYIPGMPASIARWPMPSSACGGCSASSSSSASRAGSSRARTQRSVCWNVWRVADSSLPPRRRDADGPASGHRRRARRRRGGVSPGRSTSAC